MERLGAIKEGEHRDDRISHDGRIRTSVRVRITRADWPSVRDHIRALLARDILFQVDFTHLQAIPLLLAEARQ
jgi:hypothetical protein